MSKLPVGGQAVIEGVMMKSPRYYGVSVRLPDDSIHTKTWKYKGLAEQSGFFRLPVIRGMVNMYDMLRLGLKTLSYSSEVVDEEEKISDFWMTATIIFSLLLAVGLFVLLPYAVTHLAGVDEEGSPILFNVVDGAIKILLFLGYVYLISRWDEIRRTFQYHGAEHMAVNCYEAGKELNYGNVKKFGTYHSRCGTSFVVIVFLVMVVLFSFIPTMVYAMFPDLLYASFLTRKLVLMSFRLAFILPVAGISYEVLKLSFRYDKNPLLMVFSYPGKLFQSITTKKPTKDQIEVAISALKSVLVKENLKS